VGRAIADKTVELLTTGQIAALEKLQAEVPPSLVDLLALPHLGAKKLALFWREAGIEDLSGLEEAARAGRLQGLPGVGRKAEAKILAAIETAQGRSPRLELVNALPLGRQWQSWLAALPGVARAEIAGSLRRRCETVGGLDFAAVVDDPDRLKEPLGRHPALKRILTDTPHRLVVELQDDLRLQVGMQPSTRFGSLWLHQTGSEAHTRQLDEYARQRGLRLTANGVWAGEEAIQCPAEQDVYQALGLAWIPPELREGRGEIAAAAAGSLPHLVSETDLQSDLHLHTDWSDGRGSIQEMAQAARSRGLKILAITDHANDHFGLNPAQFPHQHREIERVQTHLGQSLKLLKGCEVDILSDGSLGLADGVLIKLDIVVASLHFDLKQPKEEITARLLRAMRNPHVNIIAHPGGKLRPRLGADLDWPQIFAAAAEYGVALEINANAEHYGLNEILARQALEKGALLCINTDSHAAHQFERVEFAVSIARRAGVPAGRVINTWPAARLLAWLKQPA
jgi:DNA polymerase (family 10)